MKRSSIRSDIFSAEFQLAQTKRESREHFAQIGSAIRSRLAQPSSLLVATGLGALLGVWLARRNKLRVAPDNIAAVVSPTSFIPAFLFRFGMQRLASAWTRVRDSGSATK